jgi:hypothetical protein
MIDGLPAEIEQLWWRIRQISERKHRNMKKNNRNSHLRSIAVEIGDLGRGVEYWIVEHPMSGSAERMIAAEEMPDGFAESGLMKDLLEMRGALNGYVAFPKRRAPLRGRRWDDLGIAAYVPVHGGITYAVKDQTACVYGFDTGHITSDGVPRADKKWIAWQCRVLHEGIRKAELVEKAYVRAQTDRERIRLVRPLLEMVPEQELSTHVMLKMLTGRI